VSPFANRYEILINRFTSNPPRQFDGRKYATIAHARDLRACRWQGCSFQLAHPFSDSLPQVLTKD
jgi:hypothetical protein